MDRHIPNTYTYTRQMVIIRGELEQDPFWEWDRESVA